MSDDANLSENHTRFVHAMCKFKNAFNMDRIVGMKKSEFVMMVTIEKLINDTGVVMVSNVSNELKMTNAAASKTIGILEDEGYLLKKVNKADKRQVYIELTSKGKEKMHAIKNEMDSFTDGIIKRIGSEDSEKLFELMDKLYDAMLEESKVRFESK